MLVVDVEVCQYDEGCLDFAIGPENEDPPGLPPPFADKHLDERNNKKNKIDGISTQYVPRKSTCCVISPQYSMLCVRRWCEQMIYVLGF